MRIAIFNILLIFLSGCFAHPKHDHIDTWSHRYSGAKRRCNELMVAYHETNKWREGCEWGFMIDCSPGYCKDRDNRE